MGCTVLSLTHESSTACLIIRGEHGALSHVVNTMCTLRVSNCYNIRQETGQVPPDMDLNHVSYPFKITLE